MIVITGASDGLGKALAELYLSDGKRVINLSRRESLEGVESILTDLMDEKSIAAAVGKLNKENEPIEAIVNCAGVLSLEKIESLTPSEIDSVLDTNVRGPMLLISGLMEKIKRDGADIANVASTVGTKAYVDQAAYGASKWALRGFSANLQVELKDTPCRVISFCPGGFESDIFVKATGVKNEDFTFSMTAKDVASFMKQILELPKTMEVSEVIINRKQAK